MSVKKLTDHPNYTPHNWPEISAGTDIVTVNVKGKPMHIDRVAVGNVLDECKSDTLSCLPERELMAILFHWYRLTS